MILQIRDRDLWISRFENKIVPEPNTGCWLWLGAANRRGYGIYHIEGIQYQATRAAWILYKGDFTPGMEMCHKCDTPHCVNPDHLFLGTRSDNMLDCSRKKRLRPGRLPGEKNGRAKLTEEKVKEIKQLLGSKTHNEIAKQFKVSASTVGMIATGRVWTHL